METVAYHCKILHEAGLISGYNAQNASDTINLFKVSSLTWEGNDYLDKVRDNSIWGKTKDAITKKRTSFYLGHNKNHRNGVYYRNCRGSSKFNNKKRGSKINAN